jgi:hypothetical protein
MKLMYLGCAGPRYGRDLQFKIVFDTDAGAVVMMNSSCVGK